MSAAEGVDILREAAARGADPPSHDVYEKMRRYGELVRAGRAELSFTYQGMPIGNCRCGRLRWDGDLLQRLVTCGSPWEELQGKLPERGDTEGSVSRRPDYVWSCATGHALFEASQHASDEPSPYMSSESIARIICCAHLFWEGTCSLWVSDVGETLS